MSGVEQVEGVKTVEVAGAGGLFLALKVSPEFGNTIAMESGESVLGHSMWKITARDCTLQEVLIMAAMNLIASSAPLANQEKRTSQKSQADEKPK